MKDYVKPEIMQIKLTPEEAIAGSVCVLEGQCTTPAWNNAPVY